MASMGAVSTSWVLGLDESSASEDPTVPEHSNMGATSPTNGCYTPSNPQSSR